MEASKAVRFAGAPGWETTQRVRRPFDTLTQKLCQSFLAPEPLANRILSTVSLQQQLHA